MQLNVCSVKTCYDIYVRQRDITFNATFHFIFTFLMCVNNCLGLLYAALNHISKASFLFFHLKVFNVNLKLYTFMPQEMLNLLPNKT